MNSFKYAINKILNVKKLILTTFICLVITELLLVVFKLLFNVWYPIVCESETFINICNFIDDHLVLRYINACILYTFNGVLIFLIYTNKRKYENKKFLLIYSIILVLVSIIKYNFNIIGMIFETTLIIYCIYLNIKNNNFKFYRKRKNLINVLFPILFYLFINIWQLNISFIHGIDELYCYLPVLVVNIIMLDYYFLLFIIWFGGITMSAFGFGWIFGKTDTELLAIKEQELAKENPDSKLIEAIDKELARRKEQK